MLKHLPEKPLKTIGNTYLYSKKPIYYTEVKLDRRNLNGAGTTAPTGSTEAQIATLKTSYAKDQNIDDSITKFKNIIKNAFALLYSPWSDQFSDKNRL